MIWVNALDIGCRVLDPGLQDVAALVALAPRLVCNIPGQYGWVVPEYITSSKGIYNPKLSKKWYESELEYIDANQAAGGGFVLSYLYLNPFRVLVRVNTVWIKSLNIELHSTLV